MYRTCLFVGVFLLGFVGTGVAQTNDTLDAVDFSFENNQLVLTADNGDTVSVSTFQAPEIYYTDLNNDDSEEIVVFDKTQAGYKIYVYSADSLIFLVDSINAGRFEPNIEYNDEIELPVLVTERIAADSLLMTVQLDSVIYPQSYYVFDGERIRNAADELYSTYLKDNTKIVDYLNRLDKPYTDCSVSAHWKAAVFTAYLNYRSAGEFSIANALFSQYYKCTDFKQIKALLDRM